MGVLLLLVLNRLDRKGIVGIDLMMAPRVGGWMALNGSCDEALKV